MHKPPHNPPGEDEDQQFLQERVAHLESMERWHLKEFDVLSGISQIQEGIEGCTNRQEILQKSAPYLDRIPEIGQYGFCLINESSSEFSLNWVSHKEARHSLQCAMESMIRSGDFGWALKSDQVQLKNIAGDSIVLVRLSIPGKTIGIFIAKIPSSKAFKKHYQRLLSAALQHITYALHSQRLYQQINTQNDYLEKLIDEKNQELEHANSHDPLTNLPSKTSFRKHLDQSLARASRNGENLTLIIIDLDFF